MAVFRVEKTGNYTIMANHHLKNRALSLKAKGLLSVMLSLPDEWDYTLKGLAHISKEGIDAIREALRELERAGYVQRNRSRNAKGQLAGAEYVIYEQPVLTKPVLENPTQAIPTQGKPVQEKPTQLNTHRTNTHKSNNETPSIHPSLEAMRRCKDDVMDQIEYDALVEDTALNVAQLDEIVELMTETLCTVKERINLGGEDYPAEVVKSRFKKLNSAHIEYVLGCLKKTTTQVRNIRKYLLTMLYNAPTTMDSYMTAEFNHQYYGPRRHSMSEQGA